GSGNGVSVSSLGLSRRVEADLAKLGNQVCSPAIDVLLLDHFAQALHAGGPFFGFHLQGEADRLSGAFDVVRIHQNSVAQLARGSGKTAEHQHSLFVIASRDELLGHQVHAIVQRRDQANVCAPGVTVNLRVTVLAVQEDNRLPLSGLKAPVNTLGFSFYVGEEVVIALDVSAAGSANLHEGEFF